MSDASDKGKKIETFESQAIGKPATSSSRDKGFSGLVKDAAISDGQGNECVVKAQSNFLGGDKPLLLPAYSTPSSSASWVDSVMSEKDTLESAATMESATLSKKPFNEQIATALTQVASPIKSKKRSHRQITATNVSGLIPKKTDTYRDCNTIAATEVQALPYQSIISLKMPPRPFLIPGQPIPEPDPNNLPFGDTENYNDSMIIHYTDELGMTYTKAADLYSAKFPRDAITDEAVRKRHIRCLMRLKKRFGVKSQQELEKLGEVSRIVRRRGIKRAKGISDIVPEAGAEVENRMITPSVDSAPTPELDILAEHPSKKRKHVLPSHLFEKCRIVIWRDAEGLGWKDIRDKLEMEYKWSLGMGTI